MLKNENIICISSIDWDFIWQGHQEIMSTLAKNGNRILFIENTGVRAPGVKDIPRLKKRIKNYFKGIKGIRREADNLYIVSPILLPFPYSWIARKINKILLTSLLQKWMKIMDFSNHIIWAFLPTGLTIDIINSINKKLTIYYCIDNFSVSSSSAKKIYKTEQKLIKMANLVFVTSKSLYDYCSNYNNNITIFPFGVSVESFWKAREAICEEPKELVDIHRPIIGYVGGIHRWINQELIKFLARSLPEYSFVFIGPIQTDVSLLSDLKNIYFLGNKNHDDLPLLIKYFTAGIIPYYINDYTKNVYPTKLNEYLVMGKPVVSTALPEVEIFNNKNSNIVYIAKNEESFKNLIMKSIEEDNRLLEKKRIEIAKENSWDNRIEQMSNLIEQAIVKRKIDKDLMWKENLLVFYHNLHLKIIKIVIPSFIAYILLFYTPLIWFLAEPLKISEQPQKSEAIVVFAGGVGESGKAMQGYEERVKYAADLYKQGYANNVIFSSGYMYTFKEPEVMKLLAISLGIPEEAIILDDRARNLFENIKFTKEILDNKKWDEILLISSPYSMLRASLVYESIAKNIRVTYAPIQNSLFYSRPKRDIYGKKIWKQINLQQIKGLVHEYFGIVYYKLKKYI